MKTHRSRPCRLVCWLIFVLLVVAPGVRAGCTVSAAGVAFGNYDVFSSEALTGAGDINVVCTPISSYTVSLSAGGGSYSQRELSSGSNVLSYNLYTHGGYTVIWGDGTGGTSTVGGNGEDVHHTVHGRIPALQNVPAGSYTDTIVVTVTF